MSLRRLLHPRKHIPFARWGCRVYDFQLPTDGFVQYAQWLHPSDSRKEMSQAEVDGLRQFLKPGDFAIDIGAHSGDTTVPIALAAGRNGCVLALEPNPHVYEVLEVNSTLNPDKTNIQPRCFAATEAEGEFTFHYTDASFNNGGYRSAQRWKLFRRRYPLKVKGLNLLKVLREEFAAWLPKLKYVKVDAEGYDRAVLQTILPVLKESRPVIRTEVFRKLLAAERHALYNLLAEAGYNVHRYEGGAAPRGRRLELADMTAEKHFDLIAMPKGQRNSAAA